MLEAIGPGEGTDVGGRPFWRPSMGLGGCMAVAQLEPSGLRFGTIVARNTMSRADIIPLYSTVFPAYA